MLASKIKEIKNGRVIVKDSKTKDMLEDKYKTFLDKLRKSGKTNMFSAAPFLQQMFDLSPLEARKILQQWMQEFESDPRTEDEAVDPTKPKNIAAAKTKAGAMGAAGASRSGSMS